MDTQQISKKPGETHQVILLHRGSAGLLIQWEVSDEKMATVERIDSLISEKEKPGDPLQVRYQITLLRQGEVTVHFYETQPWDDDFPKITLEHLTFVVM